MVRNMRINCEEIVKRQYRITCYLIIVCSQTLATNSANSRELK